MGILWKGPQNQSFQKEHICFTVIYGQFLVLMLIRGYLHYVSSLSSSMYTTYFTQSMAPVWFIFGLLVSVFTFSNVKKEFFMCLLYILDLSKDLENQKVPGWPRDIWSDITGFILGFGFSFCFSKFELPGFVPVPPLELFRTSWFCSSSWNPTFVCSLVSTTFNFSSLDWSSSQQPVSIGLGLHN